MEPSSTQPLDLAHWLGQPLFQMGGAMVSAGMALAAAGLVALALIVLAWRKAAARAANEAAAGERAREAEARMAELVASQNELTGRVQTMAEVLSNRQGDLMRAVNERLESMSGRIGQSIEQTTKNTQESLGHLKERLAVIDQAQSNITQLSSQVVELQHILADKQTRGAFGEGRMQAIVKDGLPKGAYRFQPELSNKTRPDCLIAMPNDSPDLVIDAKFPLEAWNAMRAAETDEAVKVAQRRFRTDVDTHIKAIAEKYLLAGETQDTAFMFVPSESIFADIHENFEPLVQKAHRARVVIVSPSLLMLSIQVIQSVLKDVRMREQAHLIQGEIVRLMEDVGRLDERVRKLASHFNMTQKDVEEILISTRKVTSRGGRIAELEFDDGGPGEVAGEEQPRLKAVE